MRYLLVFFTLLIFSTFAIGSDIVFYEHFFYPVGWMGSADPPTGWQIVDDGIPDYNDWHQYGGRPSAPLARVTWYPSEMNMRDELFKDDIDCSEYENLVLSYWLTVDWFIPYTGYYSGYFAVFGSNDQFSTFIATLFYVSWPDNITSSTMFCDISSWADNQPTVGVSFCLFLDHSYGLDWLNLDSVYIEGDINAYIQPTSLGKIKALYK